MAAREVANKFARFDALRLWNLANDLAGSLHKTCGICAYNEEANERRLALRKLSKSARNKSTKIGGMSCQKWQCIHLKIKKSCMKDKKVILNMALAF